MKQFPGSAHPALRGVFLTKKRDGKPVSIPSFADWEPSIEITGYLCPNVQAPEFEQL